MADLSAPSGEFRSKSMDISVDELVPCCGCICFITSCFTEWPDWFGCVGKRIFLCCYEEFVAYKILDENDKKWFHVFKGSFWLAPIKTLCLVREWLTYSATCPSSEFCMYNLDSLHVITFTSIYSSLHYVRNDLGKPTVDVL